MVTLSKKPKLNGHIVQSIKLKAHVTQAGLNCSKRIAYSWSCRQRASLVGAFVLGKLRPHIWVEFGGPRVQVQRCQLQGQFRNLVPCRCSRARTWGEQDGMLTGRRQL